MRALVLDSGALIALDNRNPRFVRIADAIVRERIPTFVPAGVVAQVWRGDPRQYALTRFLASRAVTTVALDLDEARRVGALLGRSRTSDETDAHVALLAGDLGAIVYTSDPGDIRAINPDLTIEPV